MLKVTFQDGRTVDVTELKIGTVIFYSPTGTFETSDDWVAYHLTEFMYVNDELYLNLEHSSRYLDKRPRDLIWGR